MVDNIPIQPSSAASEVIEQTFKRWSSVAIVGVIAFLAAWGVFSYVQKQRNAERGQAWRSFGKFEAPFAPAEMLDPALATLPEELRPWAQLTSANRQLRSPAAKKEQFDEAKPLFEKLAANAATSPAASGLALDGMSAKAVVASIDAFVAWENASASFLDNPAPSNTEKARIVTELGNIEIAFYPDAAPEHVKNFRQLVREGFYQRTKFHQIIRTGVFAIQGGDPNTIDGAPDKWGQGTKGDGIPLENNKLSHLRGVVGMAKLAGSKKSSGCQFYIVTKDSHARDADHTIFGKVVAGMDIVDKIAALELEPNTDRPKVAVMISKTEIF